MHGMPIKTRNVPEFIALFYFFRPVVPIKHEHGKIFSISIAFRCGINWFFQQYIFWNVQQLRKYCLSIIYFFIFIVVMNFKRKFLHYALLHSRTLELINWNSLLLVPCHSFAKKNFLKILTEHARNLMREEKLILRSQKIPLINEGWMLLCIQEGCNGNN